MDQNDILEYILKNRLIWILDKEDKVIWCEGKSKRHLVKLGYKI